MVVNNAPGAGVTSPVQESRPKDDTEPSPAPAPSYADRPVKDEFEPSPAAPPAPAAAPPPPAQSAPPPSGPLGWLSNVGNAVSNAVDTAKQAVSNAVDTAKQAVQPVVDAVQPVVDTVKPWVDHLVTTKRVFDDLTNPLTQNKAVQELNPFERAGMALYTGADLFTLGGVDSARLATAEWIAANQRANANGTNIYGTDPKTGEFYFRPENFFQNEDLRNATVGAGVQATLVASSIVSTVAQVFPSSFVAKAQQGALQQVHSALESAKSAVLPKLPVLGQGQMTFDGPTVHPKSVPGSEPQPVFDSYVHAHGKQLPGTVTIPDGVTVNFTGVEGAQVQVHDAAFSPDYIVEALRGGEVVHDLQFFPGNFATATPLDRLPETLSQLLATARPGDVFTIDACRSLNSASPVITQAANGVITYVSKAFEMTQKPLFNLLPFTKI